METTLPWIDALLQKLPGRVRYRARDGAGMLHMQKRVLRARPGSGEELQRRASAPSLFLPLAGVIPNGDAFFLIETPLHGQRLDRAGDDTRYRQLATLVWTLHAHGHDVDDIVPSRMIATDSGVRLLELPGHGEEHRAATALAWARAFLTGRKATAGLRADSMAKLVLRLLGGEEAAGAMLRSALAQLPDVESWRAHLREQLDRGMQSEIPRVLVANDTEQAAAIHALLCEAAIERGTPAGDGPAFSARGGRDVVRLLGPMDAKSCFNRLGRLSPCPTLAVVVGAPLDVTRELEPVAEIAPPPQVSSRGVYDWLRPLNADASMVAETLVPALCDDPVRARQLVAALIERSGARMTETGLAISGDWAEHWQAIRGKRTALSVVQPDAARVAKMLALSPGGLNAKAVDESSDLSRGANLLQDIGLAIRDGDVLRAAEGARMQPEDVSTRRALLQWLSERDWLAPDQRPMYREAWRIGLRLRAGDLACWHDDDAEKLFRKLLDEQAYQPALQLVESHAAGAVKTPAGPPSIDVLYLAHDIGMAFWKPPRLRRLLRMWLRNYTGELRALALALQGFVERRLGGTDAYVPLLIEAAQLCAGLARFPREQALIEMAHCCCFDDPARALEYLKGVGKHPARAAGYMCEARIQLIHAECEFIAIRIEESVAHVQKARDAIPSRANRVRKARVLAEIETRQFMCHNMLTFYRTDTDVIIQPLRDLQREHGCIQDVLSAALVNDSLMRMRTWEVGSMTPEDIDFVLAEARPDNLRGYLIAVYQLEENALYRGELGIARQLSSRVGALNRTGESNRMVYSAWRRHEALLYALSGDLKRALREWSGSRTWHLPKPWDHRTSLIRHGEWGVMLLMAGKYERAYRQSMKTFLDLAAMSAGGRGSLYFVMGLYAALLAGREVTEDEHETLGQFLERSYIHPRLPKLLIDAVGGALDWSSLSDRIEQVPAPDLWKAVAFAIGAVLAKRHRSASADELARIARGQIRPDWLVLREWLDREFPSTEPIGDELPNRVLRTLAEMSVPADASQRALAELAARAVERALDAKAVVVQIGIGGSTWQIGERAGGLGDAVERAMLGDTVAENGTVAVGLRSPFGALAARVEGDSESALPAMHAITRRLAELYELAEARSGREERRRRAREAVRAGWALASGDPAPAQKLQALRALLMAETAADNASLAVLRDGQELLRAGSLANWSGESAHSVDHSLSLRARIAGGDAYSLDESTRRAAQAFASILANAPERLRLELGRPGEDEELVVGGEKLGSSPAARKLYEDLRRFADIDMPLTVVGEPGSGKDLVARALHAFSGRAAQPHVVIDCATLRRETAASELFGHVRGAFTGATHDHVGLLERAGEGTLQVDHIGDLEPSIQAMLLRAFQVRSFLPMGALNERELHARIVVTSERTLDELVGEGVLREDLAQRLAGIQLKVPPLRERGGDALLIARELLQRQSQQLNRRLKFSKSAERWIAEHDWPGNMRELRAGVMRAAVVADREEVGPDDLKSEQTLNGRPGLLLPSDVEGLNTTERLILGSLRQHGEASPRTLTGPLGLSRTTVSTTLSRLSKKGLAKRQGRGRATRYVAL